MLAYRVLPLSHRAGRLYHAAMHTVTLVLVTLALTAVIYFHDINHYPHLSAPHAISIVTAYELPCDTLTATE